MWLKTFVGGNRVIPRQLKNPPLKQLYDDSNISVSGRVSLYFLQRYVAEYEEFIVL